MNVFVVSELYNDNIIEVLSTEQACIDKGYLASNAIDTFRGEIVPPIYEQFVVDAGPRKD